MKTTLETMLDRCERAIVWVLLRILFVMLAVLFACILVIGFLLVVSFTISIVQTGFLP